MEKTDKNGSMNNYAFYSLMGILGISVLYIIVYLLYEVFFH